MKPLFGQFLNPIIYFLFDEGEFKRLQKDMERRFRKPSMNSQSEFGKLRYLRKNIQSEALVSYRLFSACRVSLLRNILAMVYRRYSEKTGIEFFAPFMGGGVILPHWGRIILNAAHIGEDLYVFHNVTIGNDYTSGKPKIGNNVFIGTNSVIVGDITVGDNVVIGACSFVNTSIPSNSIVAGNPAKVIKSIDDEYISRMLGY